MATARIVNFSLADLLGLSAEQMAEMLKESSKTSAGAEALAVQLTRNAVAALGEERQAFKNGDEVRPKALFRTGKEARLFVIDTFQPFFCRHDNGTAHRYDMRVGAAKIDGLEIHAVESIMFELVPPEEKPADVAPTAEPDRIEQESV